MLVPSAPLLAKARVKKYAVPAFNINNVEVLRSVMQAAEELRSPVIVQTSEGAVAYAGMDMLVAMVRVAARAKLPVVLHLDHGKQLATVRKAIVSGYTSVMYDGSRFSEKQNIAKTKEVVRLAHAAGLSVEAELGVLAGIEDLVSADEQDATLTDPNDAAAFVKATGCDALAIAIGTSHGAFKFTRRSHLDIERLQKIAKRVSIPLVLHGASGVPQELVKKAKRFGARLDHPRGVSDADIKAAIRHGIAKINIDTDLRMAFTAGLRESLVKHREEIDPRKLLASSIDEMTALAKHKMKLFGSAGRA